MGKLVAYLTPEAFFTYATSFINGYLWTENFEEPYLVFICLHTKFTKTIINCFSSQNLNVSFATFSFTPDYS